MPTMLQEQQQHGPSAGPNGGNELSHHPLAILARLRTLKASMAPLSDLGTPPATASTPAAGAGHHDYPPSPTSLFDQAHVLSPPGQGTAHVGPLLQPQAAPPLRSRRPSPLRTVPGAAAMLDGSAGDPSDDADYIPSAAAAALPAPSVPTGGRTATRGGPSRYRGVVWHKSNSKWEARIYEGGKQKFLGYFTNEDAAAAAYDDYAVRLHGSAAKLNFPDRYAGVELPPPSKALTASAGGRATPRSAVPARPRTASAAAGGGGGGRVGRMRVQPVKGSSRFRGVSWNSNCGKWRAQVWKGSEVHHLGYFEREDDAARAYDEAVLRIRGPDAPTNYPRSDYGVYSDEEEAAPHPAAAYLGPAGAVGDPEATAAAGMRGVSWAGLEGGWVAEIWDGRKYKLIGAYATEAAAARAYDIACLEQHGADALTNFPLGCYDMELAALALRDLAQDPGGVEAWMPNHLPSDGAAERSQDLRSGAAAATPTAQQTSDTGAAAVAGTAGFGSDDGLVCPETLELSSQEVAAEATPSAGTPTRGVSSYQGVSYDKRKQRWFSQIQLHGKRHFLGYFEDEAGAARAYDSAALKLHGSAAVLNFAATAGSTNPAGSAGSSAACSASFDGRQTQAETDHAQAAEDGSDTPCTAGPFGGGAQASRAPTAAAAVAEQHSGEGARRSASPLQAFRSIAGAAAPVPASIAASPTQQAANQQALFNFLRAMGHPLAAAAAAAAAAPSQSAAPRPAAGYASQVQQYTQPALQAVERLRAALVSHGAHPAAPPAAAGAASAAGDTEAGVVGAKRGYHEAMEQQQRAALAAWVSNQSKKVRTWQQGHSPMYSVTASAAMPVAAAQQPPALGPAGEHAG